MTWNRWNRQLLFVFLLIAMHIFDFQGYPPHHHPNAVSPNHELMSPSLPPVSTFRPGPGIGPGGMTTASGTSSVAYSGSSPANGADMGGGSGSGGPSTSANPTSASNPNGSSSSQQTGDALGKALASVSIQSYMNQNDEIPNRINSCILY